MDCPHHEHVENVLKRLEIHSNGGHVQRYEVDHLKAELSRQSEALDKLCTHVAKMVEDNRVEAARRDGTTKLLVALVGALGVITQLIVMHYLK